MKLMRIMFVFLCITMITTGCKQANYDQIQNVGLLLDGEIEDHEWNKKGYEGLQQIEENFDVNVYYKENITTEEDIVQSIDEFVKKGTNLIFGHGSIYGSLFQEIEDLYPDVHFVYFNGGYYNDHVTSLNFNGHAMGFFSGMIAGEMSRSGKVGIIASFESQPEIEGFYEGAIHQNSQVEVHVNYINHLDDTGEVTDIYNEMLNNGVDVFYPAGYSFSEQVIEKAEKNNVYAIGYIADQTNIAPSHVLTSTVQNVEQLYEITAEQFNNDEIEGDVLVYDFADELLTLGDFNEQVPASFQIYMEEVIEEYKETGILPNK